MADSRGGHKRKWTDAKQGLQHGGRGRGRKRQDMGRNDWNRQQHNRRAENDERNEKRQQPDTENTKDAGAYPEFSKDEIDAEGRRPKHKVAVMIGYSGTGYKGMQINLLERTIEGDLFAAFVAAGAISKANANDPKKSALVRCARTDKGVHAAGNVISLKLIIEDPDIVSKINSHLSPQIRVWGLQRTVNSFSCYQACDSRWYEYLMPSHAFLPPHPSTYLGKQIAESAGQTGDAGYETLQADVADFWSILEENTIKPITDALDASIKDLVLRALYDIEVGEEGKPAEMEETVALQHVHSNGKGPGAQPAGVTDAPHVGAEVNGLTDAPQTPSVDQTVSVSVDSTDDAQAHLPTEVNRRAGDNTDMTVHENTNTSSTTNKAPSRKQLIDTAVKSLRSVYTTAKRAYRISPSRLERVASALECFVGTKNFHNYTIEKTFKDPSAKRVIKSFQLNKTPIVINGTEWLSLKIHGQSFMMHQIRKMVSMVALTVRCGCPTSRITETLGPEIVSVPKAPGLGLLLERPVFDSYNNNIATKFDKEKIDFTKYEAELLEFKQREIYERIFREEEQSAAFLTFFNQVDAYKEPQFLYLTSRGLEAVKNIAKKRNATGPASKAGVLDSDGESGGEEDMERQ